MTTRRDAIIGGAAMVAAGTLPLAEAGVLSDSSNSQMASAALYKVIFDQRQPIAQSFARRAEAAGQIIYGLADDPTSLWYEDLYHRWRDAPLAVAGMTTEHVALCLQLYAEDAGLRLVYRGEHRLGHDGVAEHRFHSVLPLMPAKLHDDYDWSADVVRMISTADRAPTADPPLAVRGGAPAGLRSDCHLVSWLLAPIRRT